MQSLSINQGVFTRRGSHIDDDVDSARFSNSSRRGRPGCGWLCVWFRGNRYDRFQILHRYLQEKEMTDAPNCWKCRFFKISWDPKFPYECEAMGFKSHGLPCAQVLSVDGRECQSFAVKRVNSNQKQPLDKINGSTDRSA